MAEYITVRLHRKLVVFENLDVTGYWQNGDGCQTYGCSYNLQLSVTGAGVSYVYSLVGNASGPPPGSGWSCDEGYPYCLNQQCEDCESRLSVERGLCHDGPPEDEAACIEAAEQRYQACIAALPPGSRDFWLGCFREQSRPILLPGGATQNGPVTLHLQSSGSSGWPPAIHNGGWLFGAP